MVKTRCTRCGRDDVYIPTNQSVVENGQRYELCEVRDGDMLAGCWSDYRSHRMKIVGEHVHREPDSTHRFPLKDGDFPGETRYLTVEETSEVHRFLDSGKRRRSDWNNQRVA